MTYQALVSLSRVPAHAAWVDDRLVGGRLQAHVLVLVHLYVHYGVAHDLMVVAASAEPAAAAAAADVVADEHMDHRTLRAAALSDLGILRDRHIHFVHTDHTQLGCGTGHSRDCHIRRYAHAGHYNNHRPDRNIVMAAVTALVLVVVRYCSLHNHRSLLEAPDIAAAGEAAGTAAVALLAVAVEASAPVAGVAPLVAVDTVHHCSDSSGMEVAAEVGIADASEDQLGIVLEVVIAAVVAVVVVIVVIVVVAAVEPDIAAGRTPWLQLRGLRVQKALKPQIEPWHFDERSLSRGVG